MEQAPLVLNRDSRKDQGEKKKKRKKGKEYTLLCVIYEIMCLLTKAKLPSLSDESSLECIISCESKHISNLYLPNFLHPRNGTTPCPTGIYKVNLTWLKLLAVLLLCNQLHRSLD